MSSIKIFVKVIGEDSDAYGGLYIFDNMKKAGDITTVYYDDEPGDGGHFKGEIEEILTENEY